MAARCIGLPLLLQNHINEGFPKTSYHGDDRVEACRLCGVIVLDRMYQLQGEWVAYEPKFDPAIGGRGKHKIACVPICDKCNVFDTQTLPYPTISIMGFPFKIDNVYHANK